MKQLPIAQCSGNPTYWNTSYGREEHLAGHKSFISSLNILFNQEDDDLSCLYWITKLSFHLMHVYNSVRVSVLLLYYNTIDISEWKVEYLGKTKSCTNRVGVSVRIRVRVRVRVWVSVKYYVIKVFPESFRIRVFR